MMLSPFHWDTDQEHCSCEVENKMSEIVLVLELLGPDYTQNENQQITSQYMCKGHRLLVRPGYCAASHGSRERAGPK